MNEPCLMLGIIGMYILGLVAIVCHKKVYWSVGLAGTEVLVAPDHKADSEETIRKENKPRKRAG
jgi:hypothetical protein